MHPGLSARFIESGSGFSGSSDHDSTAKEIFCTADIRNVEFTGGSARTRDWACPQENPTRFTFTGATWMGVPTTSAVFSARMPGRPRPSLLRKGERL